jgi:hypothetical protein
MPLLFIFFITGLVLLLSATKNEHNTSEDWWNEVLLMAVFLVFPGCVIYLIKC